ncbi:branched-chain amino acid ABC transporter substrate-binding protein [Nocardioides marmoriginsengisoli]|uniref:Branched-chain amino acid ABC transporter substrate-binding protein n=1 Tax=Nocardioides marmoriginsengisoli TaxID=661483 RepID=A0A3N0CN95_9ACTN|nr:branched-chain amino acid ABC transporter substrate-binding protein [Nocardioides marmoriginsengisoli]RNL64944.1 branched-chain amino acid ABC transporter substrate-binding protein [Nocardioides marmoriginsengisoli]
MIRSKKTLRGVVALAGVAALTLSACGSDDGDKDKDNGSASGSALCGKSLAFLGALTGDAGALGQNMVNGIDLALKEYNAKNADCKVTLKEFDSQGSPDKAPALATQIINDDSIFGLIGPGFSGESLATGKTFFEAGLPSISPSATNVTITQQGWTTWHRVIGNDDAQGKADAKYLTETAGATKVFVVDDGQDYSKGLAGTVKTALGSAMVDSDQISVGDTNMSAVVTSIKNSGADAVFYGGYYTEAGLLAKQLRQGGFKGTFMSGDGSQDPNFVKVAGADAANGAVLSAPAGPAPAGFEATGLYATQSYDATNIFLAALEDGAESSEDINKFIGSYTNADGISGPIAFDDKGDIKESKIYAYFVKDGVMDVENPEPIE